MHQHQPLLPRPPNARYCLTLHARFCHNARRRQPPRMRRRWRAGEGRPLAPEPRRPETCSRDERARMVSHRAAGFWVSPTRTPITHPTSSQLHRPQSSIHPTTPSHARPTCIPATNHSTTPPDGVFLGSQLCLQPLQQALLHIDLPSEGPLRFRRAIRCCCCCHRLRLLLGGGRAASSAAGQAAVRACCGLQPSFCWTGLGHTSTL